MKHAIFLVVFLQALGAAQAQESYLPCAQPIRPDTALPQDLLEEYRAELVVEFEQYFRDISLYIACLDAERNGAFTEAQDVTAQYKEFLVLATEDENR